MSLGGLIVSGSANGQFGKLVTVIGHSLSHWPSTSVYSTVDVTALDK